MRSIERARPVDLRLKAGPEGYRQTLVCPWSAEDAGLVRGAWVFGNRQQACQVWDALDSHIVCDLAEFFESLSLLFAVLSRLAVLVLIMEMIGGVMTVELRQGSFMNWM